MYGPFDGYASINWWLTDSALCQLNTIWLGLLFITVEKNLPRGMMVQYVSFYIYIHIVFNLFTIFPFPVQKIVIQLLVILPEKNKFNLKNCDEFVLHIIHNLLMVRKFSPRTP